MDRYRPYDGRRSSGRRRRSAAAYTTNDKSARRAIKLFICVGLFVAAALLKVLFPSAITAMGDKLNTVVNYKAALTSLGEGISGEKKFTTALGEAFTYAFTGGPGEAVNAEKTETESTDTDMTKPQSQSSSAAVSSSDGNNDAAAAENTEDTDTVPVFSEADGTQAASSDTGTSAEADTQSGDSFSNAVVAAFIESQEEYSDYAIPAGVTYDMPRISITHASVLNGTVSSPFGYRKHPIEKTVKFHYGTDIVAKKGTPISAFADGKVIAAGNSATLGNYVIISHGNVESEYAHCASISVESGQTVKMGDKIATVGDTGNATETCLHLELKVNGQYVNPEYYI